MSGNIEISREQLDGWLIALNARSSVTAPIKKMRNELRALLAAPVVDRQELVAAVLPERKAESSAWGHDMGGNYDEGYADGWNACLDKVKELNQ